MRITKFKTGSITCQQCSNWHFVELVLSIIFFSFSCINTELKKDLKSKTYFIDYNNSKLKSATLSELIKEINFIPLQCENFIFGYPASKVKIENDKIIILWNQDSNTGKIGIFDLNGKIIGRLESESQGKYQTKSFTDIAFNEDTIDVLTSTNIIKYNYVDNIIVNRLELQNYYNSFIKFSDKYCCFSQNQSFALSIYDLQGKLIKDEFSLKGYPTYISDAFPHFSNPVDKEYLFYFISNPTIYRISNSPFKIDTLVKFDFHHDQLSIEEQRNLVVNGANDITIANTYFNIMGKFSAFHMVLVCDNKIFVAFKLNKKSLYLFIDKLTGEFIVYDNIINDSGFPFLTNRYKVFDICTAYGNSLVILSDPEYIEYYRSQISSQHIDNNWDEVKNEISNMTPVLAFIELK